MLEFSQADLLPPITNALVNAVNCVGVMGRGMAFLFRELFRRFSNSIKPFATRNSSRPGKG
jgi:hypothetical protein